MEKNDQIQFVLDLSARITKEIVEEIRNGKIPATWDEHDLTMIFASRADYCVERFDND